MNYCKFPNFPRIVGDEEDVNAERYSQRRRMQEIIPGLFLGPYSAASKDKLPYLQERGVTHIVCIRHQQEAHIIKPNFPEQFTYLVIEAADSSTENITRFRHQVKEFIDTCLKCGGKVLVHGNVGFSRSAALVIAYLMETFNIPFGPVYKYVLERRHCIGINIGFRAQLLELEPIIQARTVTFDRGKDGDRVNLLKRKFEEDHTAMDED